jgi:hypothetical protein
MEFVQINYPQDRTVYVDDEDNGPTNTIIRVGSGTHDFDLGDPKDYDPPVHHVQVTGTTALTPLILEFHPKGGV